MSICNYNFLLCELADMAVRSNENEPWVRRKDYIFSFHFQGKCRFAVMFKTNPFTIGQVAYK